MAPNLIYLQRNTTTDLYDDFWPEWFEDTHHPDSDICYIRKDALLEWLMECKENPVITDLQKENIQEIINKIESL